MGNVRILWADDEIDLLRPQIIFLQDRGYDVVEVSNGTDAIDTATSEEIDVVFLDENMPGLSGLETLQRIKEAKPRLPVVMITKSEEENIMDEAIGGQITDYLIKPVRPQQIILTLKKILENTRLVQEKTTMAYQQEFQKIFMALQENMNHEGWVDIYRKLIYWELNLEQSRTESMNEVLNMQKSEANTAFSKFIVKHYEDWIHGRDDAPVMSHNVLKEWVLPTVQKKEKPVFLVVIDNLRFDQWKIIEPLLTDMYRVEEEKIFYSILPTATQYARNALFAGLMPLEIEKRYPKYWKNDEDEGGKNLHEEDFLKNHLSQRHMDVKISYNKVLNQDFGSNLTDNIFNYLNNDFNVIVYNFVDMLSHARTDMEVLKELANDEAAYRSITRSWFEHSPLYAALKKLADKDIHLMITTDHGTIKVGTPSKVIGDRNTTTNLRYKTGKNMQYDPKDVLAFRDPHDALLPRQHVSSSFIFAREDKYFLYPNNYNYYSNFYRHTFQHGGISLEEMLIPFISLTPK